MRRSISFVALGLAAALTLAACGGAAEPEVPDSAETTEEPTSEEPAPEETEEPSEPSASGTLTVWVDETRQAAVESAAAAFEADTGVTVETVLKNFGDIRPEFLAQVPTGEGPDITVGAHDWLGELLTNGVVAPIELGAKTAEFEAMAISAFSQDGQVYGVPYATENIALIRNVDLAPEAPATWDDAIAAGEAAGTEFPILLQVGDQGDPYTAYPLQTSFGAPVFETNDDGSYRPVLALGGDNGAAFATWLAEQGAAGVLDTAISYDIAVDAFATGKSPFIIGGPWMIGSFEGLNLAIDPIPSAGGQPATPFAGVQGFYVSAQTANALMANDFLVNYVATVEAQTAMAEAGGRAPALTAALANFADDPILTGFAAVGADAAPMPSIPEMGEVWAFWGVTQAQIISGQAADPVAAWEQMVSDIQGALDAA